MTLPPTSEPNTPVRTETPHQDGQPVVSVYISSYEDEGESRAGEDAVASGGHPTGNVSKQSRASSKATAAGADASDAPKRPDETYTYSGPEKEDERLDVPSTTTSGGHPTGASADTAPSTSSIDTSGAAPRVRVMGRQRRPLL